MQSPNKSSNPKRPPTTSKDDIKKLQTTAMEPISSEKSKLKGGDRTHGSVLIE